MNTQTINITCTAHLTENHQLKAADALISKLRETIAANECYIEELELNISEQEKEIQILKQQLEDNKIALKKVQDKYSVDVNNFIKTDIVCQKYQQEIQELKKQRDNYRDQRDKLLYQISQK